MKWQRGKCVIWRLTTPGDNIPAFESCIYTSGTIKREECPQDQTGMFLSITKKGCIKLSCQVIGTSGLKELVEIANQKKPSSFVAVQYPRETKHTVHFIQGGRHVAVYIRATCCVNLNTGLSCRLQQRAHALATPNKVCRTTRQHIPAQDTSGLKASSSTPRHLCQSHHHAGTSAQSSSSVRNVSKQLCNHMGLTAATARFSTIKPTVWYLILVPETVLYS